jgi:hypothetical protein
MDSPISSGRATTSSFITANRTTAGAEPYDAFRWTF